LAGRLVNEIKEIAISLDRLPSVDVSADSTDNYLLALAGAGAADFLITGDRRDLLLLRRYESARIITVRDFLTLASLTLASLTLASLTLARQIPPP
jgi:predicted nucleic acid-binding protein